MRKQYLFAVMLFALLGANRAQAACTTVSAVKVNEAGPAVHVTAVDQNCNPISPASLSLTAGNPIVGTPCASGAVAESGATKIAVTPDSTGLNFSPVSGATGMAECVIGITETDGGESVAGNLLVSLSNGVTSVQFTTP